MGQILPGVPVWSMSQGSRWPGLPLVVFPGNVGSVEALSEAMIKVNHGMSRGGPHIIETRQQRKQPKCSCSFHLMRCSWEPKSSTLAHGLQMILTVMTRDMKQRPQSRQL